MASRQPSLSVSGLSQIPASFPFLSNAGNATCGFGYFFPGEMNLPGELPGPDRTVAGLPGLRLFHPVALPVRTEALLFSQPGRYGVPEYRGPSLSQVND
jgi:hypothetical protein